MAAAIADGVYTEADVYAGFALVDLNGDGFACCKTFPPNANEASGLQ